MSLCWQQPWRHKLSILHLLLASTYRNLILTRFDADSRLHDITQIQLWMSMRTVSLLSFVSRVPPLICHHGQWHNHHSCVCHLVHLLCVFQFLPVFCSWSGIVYVKCVCVASRCIVNKTLCWIIFVSNQPCDRFIIFHELYIILYNLYNL